MSDLCESVKALAATIAQLRSPEGCPWDREQTLSSLSEHLQEEVCELLESVDEGDHDNFEEELGDLMLILMMYAQIAEEEGITDLAKASRRANEKLLRRHPHVFARKELGDGDPIEEVWKQWEVIKAGEKKSKIAVQKAEASRLKPIPSRLPTLLKARDTYKEIKKAGLLNEAELDPSGIEGLAQGLDSAELGKQLFDLVAAARVAGLDPEAALRVYTQSIVDKVNASEHATASE